MVMDTLQIRLSHGLVHEIDKLVNRGIYANRSDAVREAVRYLFWHKEVGTIKPKGNSVELVRNAREKLSKQKISLEEINSV